MKKKLTNILWYLRARFPTALQVFLFYCLCWSTRSYRKHLLLKATGHARRKFSHIVKHVLQLWYIISNTRTKSFDYAKFLLNILTVCNFFSAKYMGLQPEIDVNTTWKHFVTLRFNSSERTTLVPTTLLEFFKFYLKTQRSVLDLLLSAHIWTCKENHALDLCFFWRFLANQWFIM